MLTNRKSSLVLLRRLRGKGSFAGQISQMFHIARRKAGLAETGPELSAAAFRRPDGPQLGPGL